MLLRILSAISPLAELSTAFRLPFSAAWGSPGFRKHHSTHILMKMQLVRARNCISCSTAKQLGQKRWKRPLDGERDSTVVSGPSCNSWPTCRIIKQQPPHPSSCCPRHIALLLDATWMTQFWETQQQQQHAGTHMKDSGSNFKPTSWRDASAALIQARGWRNLQQNGTASPQCRWASGVGWGWGEAQIQAQWEFMHLP